MNLGLKPAKKTIKVTTQLGFRSALGPLTWRYCTDMMQQHLWRLNIILYTDTLFAKCKSIIGKNLAQVYIDGQSFVYVDLSTSKSLARLKLENLTENIEITNTIIYDGAPEKFSPNSDFQKIMRKFNIRGHQCETYYQCQNRAEDYIWELKHRWKRRMIKRRAPKRVLYFVWIWDSI